MFVTSMTSCLFSVIEDEMSFSCHLRQILEIKIVIIFFSNAPCVAASDFCRTDIASRHRRLVRSEPDVELRTGSAAGCSCRCCGETRSCLRVGWRSRGEGCRGCAGARAAGNCAPTREGAEGEPEGRVGPAGAGRACSQRCSCGPSLI